METPLEKIKKLTAWDVEPALTEGELDELILAAAMADRNGRMPSEEDWLPTYDLYGAAASAWLIKAGRASGTTEVVPETFYTTSKVFDNCCRMALIYRSKGRATVGTAPVRAAAP